MIKHAPLSWIATFPIGLKVKQLIEHGTVTTQSGQQLTLHADSLCVHGDNDAGIALIQEINALCQV